MHDVLKSAFLLLIGLELLSGGRAAADDETGAGEPEAVVIIISMQACCTDQAWPEAEHKTAAEFLALDLDVEIIDGTAVDDKEQRKELEKITEEKDAICALRIIRGPEGNGGGIDVWITDSITGKTTYKNLSVEGVADPEAASIVALRIVELLRASLLELKITGTAGGQAPAPPEVVDMIKDVEKETKESAPGEAAIEKSAEVETSSAPVSDTRETGKIKNKRIEKVGLRIGLEALGAPGGTDAMGAVNVSFRWSFLPSFSLELDNLITLLSRSIKLQNISASFDIAVIRGWILWEPSIKKWLRLAAGAGGGVLLAWSRGFVSGRHETRTDITYAGYAGATLQAAFLLTRNLWLRLGFTAGASLPGISIRFFNIEVAEFGMPLLEGFLNIEIRVP